MKKIAILVYLLFACLLVQSQPDNCTARETILLNERPVLLSQRDAYDVITGAKNKLTITHPASANKYSIQKDFPFSHLNVFRKNEVIWLEQSPDKTLPVWKTRSYYEATGETLTNYHWPAFIVGCVLSFFFGLGLINLLHKDAWWEAEEMPLHKLNRSRITILCIGLTISCVVGLIMYGIGQSKGEDSYLSGSHYNFNIREYLFHVGGIFISGYLWICFLHGKLFLKKLQGKNEMALE